MPTKTGSKPKTSQSQRNTITRRTFKEKLQDSAQNLFQSRDQVTESYYFSQIASHVETSAAGDDYATLRNQSDKLRKEMNTNVSKLMDQHELDILQLSSEFNKFRISVCRRLNELENRHQAEMAALRSQMAKSRHPPLMRSSDLDQ